VLFLEADPAVLVDHDGRRSLAGDDGGDQQGGAELRRGEDRAGDVERAEQAADPDPPRRVADSPD
jgi:hypothetical protein